MRSTISAFLLAVTITSFNEPEACSSVMSSSTGIVFSEMMVCETLLKPIPSVTSVYLPAFGKLKVKWPVLSETVPLNNSRMLMEISAKGCPC